MKRLTDCETWPLSDSIHRGDKLIEAGIQLEFGPSRNARAAEINYLKAAALGSITAEKRLAQLYKGDENGVQRNQKLSVEWERRAAEAGDYVAQDWLAFDYRDGDGVLRDDAQADYWFRKAAAQGDGFAAGQLLDIWKGHSPPPSTPEALAQAKMLGTYAPPWVPTDFVKADALSRAAAQAGAPYAQYVLAVRYRDGLHMDSDAQQAKSWFKKAAEQGYPPAQYALAEMMRDDDLAQALDWYAKAANQGVREAQEDLDDIYVHNDSAPKSPAEELAWYRKGADYGDPIAQVRLAEHYEKGMGAAPDYRAAAGWYRKAAEERNDDAAKALSRLYWSGLGVNKDPAMAYFWSAVANVDSDSDADARDGFNAPETLRFGKALTSRQRARARQLAHHWLATHPLGRQSPAWPAICCNKCTV